MDPALRRLIEAPEGDDVVAVMVRLAGPTAALPADARVVTRFGDIATVRVPRGSVLALRESDDVRSVKAPRRYRPDLTDIDRVGPVLDAGDVRRPVELGPTGRGVVVGVVDWGLDVSHPAFRDGDGRTRVLALWDQSAPYEPTQPHRFGYGRVHTADAIDAALGTDDPFRTLGYQHGRWDIGSGTHGTATTSIAAGREWPGGVAGLAPDAHIVFVNLSGGEALGHSVNVAEAIDFICEVAGDLPCVINLSLGRHGGPHDGCTLLEQLLDAVVTGAPGRLVINSTGNYFSSDVHTSGRLDRGEIVRVPIHLADGMDDVHELDVWYRNVDRLLVGVAAPDGSRVVARPGRDAYLDVDGRTVARVQHRADDPNNGRNEAVVRIETHAPAGTWHLVLVAVEIADGRYHSWIEREGAHPSMQLRFAHDDAVSSTTTGTICNGHHTIAVGAYDHREQVGTPARFSSSGDTVDGRRKPDLLAPGERVLVARSRPVEGGDDVPLAARMSGTSMAAPYVAGAAACLMEVTGPVPAARLRSALLESCAPFGGERDEVLRVGAGYLDVAAAVEHLDTTFAATQVHGRRDPAERHEAREDDMTTIDAPLGTLNPDDVLRTLGVSARELFDVFVLDRKPSERERLEARVQLVRGPGDSLDGAARPGDLLVRGSMGEGFAVLAQLVTGELLDLRSLPRADLASEGRLAGCYAWVREGGDRAHPAEDRFARRITDRHGYLPSDQALLRLLPELPTPLVVAPPALALTDGLESFEETLSLSTLEGRYFPSGGVDSAPFSRRSTVEPMVDGRDYFAALRTMIDTLTAGDAWYMAGWWIDPGFTFADGTTLAQLLVARAAAGVDVRVIFWANRQVIDHPTLAGALGAGPYQTVVLSNVRSVEWLRTRTSGGGTPLAGRVLLDWSGNAATSHHMKFNVFAHGGALTAFVGGIDYLQNRLDVPMHRRATPRPWHDAGVRLRGEAAERVLRTFVTRWTEASTLSAATYDIGGGTKPYNPPPLVPFSPPSAGASLAPSSDTSVSVIRSIPDSKEFRFVHNTPWTTLPRNGVHEIKRTFQQALAAAQRYIYIEDQTFNATVTLFPALVDACKRGVKVIAVLPGAGDPLDTPGGVPRALSNDVITGILGHLTAGQQMNFALWQTDGIVIHSKLFLVDDEMFEIGSANFMDRSMEYTSQGDDSECSVAVVSSGTLVADLRVQLWAEHLRVSSGAALAELRDLSRSLGFWRASWGAGVSFAHPDSRLVFVGPGSVSGGGVARPAGASSVSAREAVDPAVDGWESVEPSREPASEAEVAFIAAAGVVISAAQLGLAAFTALESHVLKGSFSVTAAAASFIHDPSPRGLAVHTRTFTFPIIAFHPRYFIDDQTFWFEVSLEYDGFNIRRARVVEDRGRSSTLVSSDFSIAFTPDRYTATNEPVVAIEYVISGRWDPIGRGDESFDGRFVLDAAGNLTGLRVSSGQRWVRVGPVTQSGGGPVPRPTTVTQVTEVHFDPAGSARLTDERIRHIHSWYEGLPSAIRAEIRAGTLPVQLTGRASTTGTVQANQRLARQRADAVAAVLRDLAGSSARFIVSSQGELGARTADDQESAGERRVEICCEYQEYRI